ncbi:MAG: OmpA family protein [Bacteroidales bacterium]|nr:OmpA family protein [Bacteroidales bacterium]
MKTIFFALFILSFIHVRPQNLSPTEDKALLNLKVTNFSQKPLAGEMVIFISKKDKKQYQTQTAKDGTARILLPEGHTYDIQYRDFMEQQEYSSIEIPNQPGAYTYDLAIKFEPAKTYTLKNVHFETGSATLTNDSYAALNNLYEALKAKPNLVIEIAGHTDNIGTFEHNLKLSQERANSVKKYLVSKGISDVRIVAKGYADTQPIASNNTEEGRAKNRRTEVRIIKE